MKPMKILINDHRIIEQVLNCLERMVDRCASEGRLEKSPAQETIAFFRAFAECAHLAKEEAYLFPLVAETKCPQGCSLPELMAREAQHARAHLEAMEAALEGAAAGEKTSLDRFIQHGQAYIALLMKYIENEEDWLFPQAERVLNEANQRSLAQQLQQDDCEHRCGSSRDEYLVIANRLADRFGVPRAQQTKDE